jgi:glycosyltransferase involved in cell wall biosynthesis
MLSVREPGLPQHERRAMQATATTQGRIRVLVDAVVFQILKGGIARMWLGLMQEWKKTGFIDNVIVLDRGGTCPQIAGVTYRSIEPHRITPVGEDATYLQRICEEENADLFASTYYTTPTRTPTIFTGYDMIPEHIGVGLDEPWWQQKRRAIQYAAGHVMISESSARDLARFFPGVARANVLVAYPWVARAFREADNAEIVAFRQAHGFRGPYVIMVGERHGWLGHKNGILAFAGIATLDPSERPIVVCVGGGTEIEAEYRALLPDAYIRQLRLDDDQLRAAFAGAHALIYPSRYEGFGLPVIEAMACRCPVIACANSAIPEAGGDAIIYVDAQAPVRVADAIRRLHDPTVRAQRIAAGLEHIRRFDGARSAKLIADFYRDTNARLRNGTLANPAMALDDVFALLCQVAQLRVQRLSRFWKARKAAVWLLRKLRLRDRA